MKAIIVCILSCLSVFAADTNEIRVVITTKTDIPAGYLLTFEEFTRGGQTNLLRITRTKDGVSEYRAHNFYHNGVHLGRYIHDGGYTFISSAAGAPYVLTFAWDSSNQIRAASVTTTNYVLLDSFTFTNGIFYPEDSSRIEESNRKTKDILHR